MEVLTTDSIAYLRRFLRSLVSALEITFLRARGSTKSPKCCCVFMLHSVKHSTSVCTYAPQYHPPWSLGWVMFLKKYPDKKRWMEACAFPYKFCRIVGVSIKLGI